MRMEGTLMVGDRKHAGFSPPLSDLKDALLKVNVSDIQTENGHQGEAKVHHRMDDGEMLRTMFLDVLQPRLPVLRRVGGQGTKPLVGG